MVPCQGRSRSEKHCSIQGDILNFAIVKLSTDYHLIIHSFIIISNHHRLLFSACANTNWRAIKARSLQVSWWSEASEVSHEVSGAGLDAALH